MDKYDKIAELTMRGMRRYVYSHVPPGSFLRAVIYNDLKASFMCADDDNKKNLELIVRWFHHVAPSSCWGSRIKYQEWLESGDR